MSRMRNDATAASNAISCFGSPPAASTGTQRLCEFIINPFGNERQARELLGEIERGALSEAALERGQFCFQIAFYFVALLAIQATIAGADVRKHVLHRLHQRIRASYARAARPVCVSEFVASPTERDQVAAALRRGRDRSEQVPPATMTMLALFDLIGLRRLYHYRRAVGRPDDSDALYLLADEVLLHYGGKRYHPIIVTIIADLFAANYATACSIAASAPERADPFRIEREQSLQPLPLAPGMPELAGRQPRRTYSAGRHVLLLFEDVAPIGGKAGLGFRYVLALCDRRDRRPACFVTLENSSSIANVLCVFERNGSHSNYGPLRGGDLPQDFIGPGIALIRDRFELGKIAEVPLRMRRHAWWKRLSSSSRRPSAPASRSRSDAARPSR